MADRSQYPSTKVLYTVTVPSTNDSPLLPGSDVRNSATIDPPESKPVKPRRNEFSVVAVPTGKRYDPVEFTHRSNFPVMVPEV